MLDPYIITLSFWHYNGLIKYINCDNNQASPNMLSSLLWWDIILHLDMWISLKLNKALGYDH